LSKAVSPVIVAVRELSIRFGEQIVLKDATLSVHQADRIGLIGNNGSGKSTLLKIIVGIVEPDSGSVTRRKDIITGYLSQDFQLDPTLSVYDNIVEGAHDVIAELREYESLPYTSERRHLLEDHIHHRDGWNLENRIETAMHSLNVPAKDRDITTLSGGEKRRVALCKAIISRPDLLVLDEPTNHLDTQSIEWMEEFLANYSGACLFVTHDRYFLDTIATRIVELADGICHPHDGSYTDFLLDKAERESQLETEEHKRRRFLHRELEWVRKGPRARRTKSKSRLAKYFEEADKQGHVSEEQVELVIPPASPLGTKILSLKNVGIELGGRNIFGGVDFDFDKKRKLGIIGRNGLGKTTLLKIVLGELNPTEGQSEVGERTVFNYVDQSRVALNDKNTVLEEIGEGREWIMFGGEKGGQRLTVWNYLRRFLFADDRMKTKVEKLSGGERSRLLLAKILKNGGNFLMLDEPTNDLDLATLRVLEEALIAFDGCVIAVSHDRYFLNRVCNGILAFEGDGYVHFSEGDYDYYIEKRNARFAKAEQESEAASAKQQKSDAKPKAAASKLKWKEARELETIEQDILHAEAEVTRIETIFSADDFYEKYGDKTLQLTTDLAGAKLKVERLYARWHELEDLQSRKK
jgi:ABC transport system ATP-binding/permease protein